MWARKTPLKRGNSTLKRQPFKQKFTVTTKVDDDEIEKPPKVVSRPELFRNPEMIGSEVIALPKPVKRVSPALREFASQKQCLGGFKPEVQHLPPSKVRRCHHLVRPRHTSSSSLKSASPLPA